MDLHDERKKKMKASPAASGSRRFERMEESEALSERKMEGGEVHR
jgi:ribosomal protein L44E